MRAPDKYRSGKVDFDALLLVSSKVRLDDMVLERKTDRHRKLVGGGPSERTMIV